MSEGRQSRAARRAHMEAEILRLGREQLAVVGPAQLSLREVARGLGVASSAVYRYVADRDALLTLLIVDAYEELGDSVERALGADASDVASRLQAFARAVRHWAMGNPSRWALLYGTPVPGYAAPAESTSGPGTRLMAVLLRIMKDVEPRVSEPLGGYRDFLAAGVAELDVVATERQAAAAVDVWVAVTGAVSVEIFGHLGPEVADLDGALLDQVVRQQVAGLFGAS